MSKLPVNILWKASDGREFPINTRELGLKTMEEVYEYINKLREMYGYEQPTFMNVAAKPGIDVGNTIDINELPEDLRNKVEEVIKEGWSRPDPKKQN